MKNTISQLVSEYDANAIGFMDDGDGSAFSGQLIDYDEDVANEYGDVEVEELQEQIILADGNAVQFASEWIIKGDGDNPYRVKLFF